MNYPRLQTPHNPEVDSSIDEEEKDARIIMKDRARKTLGDVKKKEEDEE